MKTYLEPEVKVLAFLQMEKNCAGLTLSQGEGEGGEDEWGNLQK